MLNRKLFIKVLLLFTLFLLSVYVSLPPEINYKGKTFKRYDLNFHYRNLSLYKKFDLKMGLDLAGGSHLVFEADLSKVSSDGQNDALESLKTVIERRVNLFGVSEPNVLVSTFQGKSRIVVELPGINDPQEAVALIGKTAQLKFVELTGEGENQNIKETDLTGADLKKAFVVSDQNTGKPAVSLQFSEDGARKFENLTGRNIGKVIPIILDNDVVSAPVAQEKIIGGNAQITGNFTAEEADNLVVQLNAGALPVPVSVVEQKTIGASLGYDSVHKATKAGLIGIICVIVFMILVYGGLGLIASFALIFFGTLTLSIYKLIPVVLTLPGIAGFLLSVGMAVDSNILIFERFREEKGKRPLSEALEVSFGRAWDSIRDANIATLVTAFILANPFEWSFLHTSGPVRGFAMTLTIGVGISLFTGIVVSRNFLRFFLLLFNRIKKNNE